MEKGQLEIVKDFVRDTRKNLVLKDYTENNITNWNLYKPILQNKLLKQIKIKDKLELKKIVYNENGEYQLYSLKYTKK